MPSRPAINYFIRIIVSFLAIVGLSALIWTSARFGFSRLLTKYSLAANLPAAATEAVRLTPADPEAHRTLATVLSKLRLYSFAEGEQERAVSLRPLDDYLWLELGNIKEELDDQNGALFSFNEAVSRAPYYAHTHWQRGNLLLRMGRGSEAFEDLRTAAKSNKNFVPGLIDLAWFLSRKDPSATFRLIGLSDDYTRIAFARFLAKNGLGSEALGQLKSVNGTVSQDVKKEIQRQLFNAKAFKEAFELWTSMNGLEPDVLKVYDGSFEGPITIGEVGFGWLIPREISAASITQDTSVANTGKRSLRITFNGNSNPQVPLVSQTLIVKAEHHYQINFSVRSKDIVTGGLPNVIATDARTGQILSKLDIPTPTTDEWQQHTLEFVAQPNSDAIILSFQRNNCSTSPCPIFGILWLDSVAIQEIAAR